MIERTPSKTLISNSLMILGMFAFTCSFVCMVITMRGSTDMFISLKYALYFGIMGVIFWKLAPYRDDYGL